MLSEGKGQFAKPASACKLDKRSQPVPSEALMSGMHRFFRQMKGQTCYEFLSGRFLSITATSVGRLTNAKKQARGWRSRLHDTRELPESGASSLVLTKKERKRCRMGINLEVDNVESIHTHSHWRAHGVLRLNEQSPWCRLLTEELHQQIQGCVSKLEVIKLLKNLRQGWPY